MNRLRLAFMGSPDFAVPCLRALAADPRVELCRVITQPDQPSGRGKKLAPTAIKQLALEVGLPVETPPSLRKPEPYAPSLVSLGLDLVVVVAYGKILPPDLLAVPRHGCWNVHASLLPRHRGAAPIQHALLAGDATTGVTLMQMDPGLDTGPMLLRRELSIDDDDTGGTLLARLAPLGAALLGEGIGRLLDGTLVATPQEDSAATLAPLLDKQDGRVDFAAGAAAVSRRVRAMDPWPGAYTTLDGEPLKLWRPRRVSGRGAPGVVLGADRDGLLVGCGDDAVGFGELQLPGRKRLPAAALLAGRAIPAGTQLGS